jgi:hypothetical protein
MSVSSVFSAAARAWPVFSSRQVALAATLLACVGCGQSESNRLPVHPVHGSITFRGGPMPGAMVSLHSRTPLATEVPTPRGSVQADGSFSLTTYNGEDGAPEGDYVLTVQWYRPIEQHGELVTGPNVLPPKYATPESSDLEVRVAGGENRLPPIEIR